MNLEGIIVKGQLYTGVIRRSGDAALLTLETGYGPAPMGEVNEKTAFEKLEGPVTKENIESFDYFSSIFGMMFDSKI